MKKLAFVCVLFCASMGWADQIIFKNGDKLSGTIKSADGGKITIDTAMTGTVTADLANVQTFSTDQPVTVRMQDGREIKQPVAATQPGNVAMQGQEAPIDQIKQINPPPVKWTGSVRAGAIITRGNSDTENFNINFDATRRTEKHQISTSAGYFFGRARDPNTGDKNTITDNWFATAKYQYFITPKFYQYDQIRVEQDRIANLDLRVTPGVGVGYLWFDRPDFKLSTEAGVDWVYEEYRTDGDSDHFAARAAYHIEKKLNDKVTVFHNLEYMPSFSDISDFNINADAGIRTVIYKNLFSEVKAEWRYDSTPAPGASDSDFRYTISLGWQF